MPEDLQAPEGRAEDDVDEGRHRALVESQSEAAYEADYAAVQDGPSQEDVRARSGLLPEEQAAGSADPEAQATAILEDSLLRTEVPGAAPSTHLEHRRSEDTV